MHLRYSALRPLHRARYFMLLLLLPLLLPAHAGILHRRHRPQVVGYFGQWGLYDDPPYYLRDLARNGGARLLDQMNYAQASVKGGRCSIADPKADLETTYAGENSVNGVADDPASPFRGYFHQLRELKERYPKLRILISLEGAAASFREGARPENRQAFVESCVSMFLRGRFAPGISEPGVFDGIDVDWEYPQQEDAANFRALLVEFRRQMDAVRHGMRLAIAVGDQPEMQPGTDFRDIARLVDQIGVMNYDYAGPWNSTTGFLAPLFPQANSHNGSIVESMAAYEKAGVPRRKMLMGLPFYGYQWSGVSPVNNGLFQRGKGVAEDKPYRFIRRLKARYAAFRDPETLAPWLFDGANFWTFEDPVSIRYKAAWAARQHWGGIMIWELGQDTAEATLLSVAWHSLQHPEEFLTGEEGAFAPPGELESEPVLSR